jgi:hypothetical protein
MSKMMRSLRASPPLAFWALFTSPAPFLRLRGVFDGGFPYAFNGLLYSIASSGAVEGEEITTRLTVPILTDDDRADLSRFLEVDHQRIDDLFRPFTDRPNVVEFVSVAFYFGIHPPIAPSQVPSVLTSGNSRKIDGMMVYSGLTPEHMLPLFAIAAESRIPFFRHPFEAFEYFNFLQPMIWTLLDRYLLEMPVPLTEFDEVCLMRIYEAFIRSWRHSRRDSTHSLSMAQSDRHLIAKISKQLWEADAFRGRLRERFVQSLAIFCEQKSVFGNEFGPTSAKAGHFRH